MTRITYQDIKDIDHFCPDPFKYIARTWSGTALDILQMKKIPATYRLTIVVHVFRCISDKTLKLFALACARCAEKYSDNECVKICNDTIEAYLNGNATAEEVQASSHAAVRAAYTSDTTRDSYPAVAAATGAATYAADVVAPYADDTIPTAFAVFGSADSAAHAAACAHAGDASSAVYNAAYVAEIEELIKILIELLEKHED